MGKLLFVVSVLLSLVFTLTANPKDDSSQSISNHLAMLRSLSTLEFSYREGRGRFADREQLLAYFREQGATTGLEKIEHLHPFQLSILASPDGAHYQMSLTPSLEETNKSGWCDKSIFTDERAVIFIGAGLGCEARTK
jgi:hypothetical protein